MHKPYRWGDVPPPAVQRLSDRRRYRDSEFFVSLKKRRRDLAIADSTLRECGPSVEPSSRPEACPPSGSHP